jgi:hypothetical protein
VAQVFALSAANYKGVVKGPWEIYTVLVTFIVKKLMMQYLVSL